MSLREIALAIDGRPESAGAARAATMLALRHGARLTALAASAPGASGLPLSVAEVALAAASPSATDSPETQRLWGLLAQVQKFAEQAGMREGLQRRLLHGYPHDVLPPALRLFDLAVVAQQDRSRPAEAGIAPGDLLANRTTPVLVVPARWEPRQLGRRVLVAWDSSDAAMRAVKAALPLLAQAEAVQVVHVPEREAEADDRSAADDLTRFLQRHAIRAEAMAAPLAHRSAAVESVLLGYAADLGADLMVAGASHRHGLRELIWGSVTGHLLADARLPVFYAAA